MTALRIHTTHKLLLALVGMLLLPMLSCSREEVCYRFRHIDGGKWHCDSVLLFGVDSLPIADNQLVQVSLEISSNHAYPYRNLWLQIEHNLTDTLFHTDTLQVMLADESGHWRGSSAGGLCQLSVPWLASFKPDGAVTGEIRISHLMTDDPLPGIEKVGVKMVVADNK